MENNRYEIPDETGDESRNDTANFIHDIID